MEHFHFLRPAWFIALIPLLLVLAFYWKRQLKSRSWQEICDPELLPHLLIGHSQRKANWPLWLVLTAILLAVLALAGPTWQKRPVPVLRQQSALIIAYDLSRSMAVADQKPNRAMRARLKIADILRQRREGQTALIAFAGSAHAVTPLTSDSETIQLLLGSLNPDMMPLQGSHPERAFELASQLLKQAGLNEGTLLMLTDEDRPEQYAAAARQLHENGLTLQIIGVGTPEGAPIPLPGGGFFKDRNGNLALPRLNETGLKALAAAGGGAYRPLTVDDSDFTALLSHIKTTTPDNGDDNLHRTGDLWQDAGVWLLWPLVILCAFAFRRGWLLIVPLVVLLPLAMPSQASALDWNGLWHNSEQRAYQDYQQQNYQGAAEGFKDPYWKASSLYQSGDYSAALKELPQAQSADDWYNRGNMLARSGQLKEALETYDKALKQNPTLTDVKENRKIVEDALKQQEQQQQDQKNQGNQQQDQGDNQKNDEDQQAGQQGEQNQQEKNSAQDQQPSTDQQSSQAQKNQEQQEQNARDKQEQQQDAQGNQQQQNDQQNRSAAQPQQQQATPQQEDQQPVSAQSMGDDKQPSPEEQQLQQYLQRIPDDPGGLLRRKFQLEQKYLYNGGEPQEDDQPW